MAVAAPGDGSDRLHWNEWGGAEAVGPVGPAPTRLPDLFTIAQRYTDRPVKVCVGAGPTNLGFYVYDRHYDSRRDLASALAPNFNAEMKVLVAGRGATRPRAIGRRQPIELRRRCDPRMRRAKGK